MGWGQPNSAGRGREREVDEVGREARGLDQVLSSRYQVERRSWAALERAVQVGSR